MAILHFEGLLQKALPSYYITKDADFRFVYFTKRYYSTSSKNDFMIGEFRHYLVYVGLYTFLSFNGSTRKVRCRQKR